MLEKLFKIRQHGFSVARQPRAGVVSFLAMACILFVNPQILATTGMPTGDENGELQGADRAFTADAIGTSIGALLGTSMEDEGNPHPGAAMGSASY